MIDKDDGKGGVNLGGIRWERMASVLFCIVVGGAFFFLAFRYLFPILFPFLAAWLFSLAVRPLATRASERFHISQKLCATVLLCLLVGGVVWTLGLLIRRLLGELTHLAERLLSAEGGLSGMLQGSVDYFETLTSGIPFLQRIGAGERFAAVKDRFNMGVTSLLEELLKSLSTGIPTFAGRMISAMPTVLLAIVVTLIAGFTFCTEGGEIGEKLTGLLPVRLQRRLPSLRERVRGFCKGYLRAYLWLLLLTFAELLVGFLILGVDYAVLLSALIALVDMLPVLGVGTVLVPWSIILLLQKNYYLGFGLLILFFAVTVLRQIIEPKLVGKTLGLHPLLSLFASYAGWQLFGFFGMLVGPFLAMLAKSAAVFAFGNKN